MSKKAKDDRNKARDVGLAVGSTLMTVPLAHLGASKLQGALKKGELGKAHLSSRALSDLSTTMGFSKKSPLRLGYSIHSKTPPSGAQGKMTLPGGGGLPLSRRRSHPLSAAAHEMGHAAPSRFQKYSTAAKNALFGRPSVDVKVGKHKSGPLKGKPQVRRLTGPMMSPLHVPLGMLAASPVNEDDSKTMKFLKKNPTALAAGLGGAALLPELHASAKALRGIKKLRKGAGGGWAGVRRELKPMARGLGSHALAQLPIIAGIYGISKIRDLLASKKASKASPAKKS